MVKPVAKPSRLRLSVFLDLNASPLLQLIKRAMASPNPQTPLNAATDLISPQEIQQQTLKDDLNRTESIPTSVKTVTDKDYLTMQKLNQVRALGSQIQNNSSVKFSNGSVIPAVLKGSTNWQWLLKFSQQLHQAETIETLLQMTVTEVRQGLQIDRVLIYQFQTEEQGLVLAESMASGYTPSLGESLPAIAFGAEQRQSYQQQVVSVENTPEHSFGPYQTQLLDKYQIQASLSIPILLGQVWGLLVVQHCSQPRQWLENEVTLLYQIATELRLRLQSLEFNHERQALTRVNDAIYQTLDHSSFIQEACQIAIEEVQQLLNVERVAIYKFRPDYFGDFLYESGAAEFPRLVGSAWEDTYLKEHKGGRFQSNGSLVVDDVHQSTLSDCHVAALKNFGVRSCAVVAIKQGEMLWGLLSAFQHSGSRRWRERDVNLLTDIGRQLGAALQGVDHLSQLQEQSTQMTRAAQVSHAVVEIIPKIFQSQNSEGIFRIIPQAVRSLLKCDRTAIYRLDANGSSTLVAESMSRGLESLASFDLSLLYPKTDLQPILGSPQPRPKAWIVNNIYAVGHTPEEIEQLEEFEIKAYAMIPIFQEEALWGFLGVYQNSQARSWSDFEVTALSQICGQFSAAMRQVSYLEQVQQQSKQLAQAAERDRSIAKIVERIRQSLDLQQIFKTTAREIRNLLSVDRVAIYRFNPESNYNRGAIVAEDIKPGYISIQSVEVDDECFSERHAASYKKGRIFAVADIHEAELTNCYVEMLTQFQVRGNLVVPLFRGEELWGLFCIHQCGGPRDWQETEIEFAKQIALQLDTAIQQGEYIEQLRQASAQMSSLAQMEKAAKEKLQQEVIQILMAVRPALDGDLTVRAPITDDEVGTIADAYNNTLSHLQEVVTEMQHSSHQIALTSQTSEMAIASLAAQAQQQFHALDQAQERVETMVHSSEAVGSSAQMVEMTAQRTNQVVLTGDAAMDRAVEGILDVRETVTETSKRLKRLSESSQKISKVVNLISNFTTQTQLLALNASIEATRAGEYGRGFSVVADEVRSLARQSANAATEIEQLVQDIQISTAEVSTALETGIQQVAAGTDLVTEARENLNEIVDATGQISQLVANITQAAQEQTQQCQSVKQTMSEVAEIANKTTEDSASISASFKELLTLATTLQTHSSQFKVD